MFSSSRIFKSIGIQNDSMDAVFPNIDNSEEAPESPSELVITPSAQKLIEDLQQYFPQQPIPGAAVETKIEAEVMAGRSIYTPTPPDQTKDGAAFTRSLSPSFKTTS